MRLIKEIFESTNLIVEERKGKKEYFIEGVFLQSELQNRNKRMYPEHVMDKAVARYMKEAVEKNRAYGELGHPDTPSINLDRVSHMITSLRKEGTNYIGRAKIMETPMGNIARGLLDGGANLGVSSRALGSLKMNNEGVNIVQDDFMLSTAADIVADPSAPKAFVQGIMENAEWILTDTGWKEVQFDYAKKQIKEASKNDIEAVALRLFENFISKL